MEKKQEFTQKCTDFNIFG